MVFGLFEDKADDAGKATEITKNYLEKAHGNLGLLLFRIEQVKPNTKEHVWLVRCSVFTSLGSSKRTYYELKVNIKTGRVEEVNKIEKPE
ncbi:MAG: hypothetical protein V1493_04920 [Candidatus Diapherotrites archaeon]